MRLCLTVICLLSLIIQAPAAWGNIFPKGLEGKPRVERIDCLICHSAKTMKPVYREVVSQ
jgi:hypothetical protein